MGQIYSAVAETATIAAQSALGASLFIIKSAASNGVRLREVEIAGVPGATSAPQSQDFKVRIVRGASGVGTATEGGVRLTPGNLHPLGRAAVSTVIRTPTAGAAATEGGVAIYSSTIVRGNAPWKLEFSRDPTLGYWCDKSSVLSILLHATDTTVFSGTLVFEEMSKGS